MNAELKVGEVVKLKSGGPHMTISEIPNLGDNGVQYVTCEWFAGSTRRTESFDFQVLTGIEPMPRFI